MQYISDFIASGSSNVLDYIRYQNMDEKEKAKLKQIVKEVDAELRKGVNYKGVPAMGKPADKPSPQEEKPTKKSQPTPKNMPRSSGRAVTDIVRGGDGDRKVVVGKKRKGKGKKKGFVSKVKKMMRDFNRNHKMYFATVKYLTTAVGTMSTALGQCTYTGIEMGKAADYRYLCGGKLVEQVGVDNAGTTTRYEQPSIAGISGNAEYRLALWRRFYLLRNNASYPCDIDIYVFDCIQDTSTDPKTWVTTALADAVAPGGPASWETNWATNPYLTMNAANMRLLKRYWKLKKHERIRLNPGDEVKKMFQIRNKTWNDDKYDAAGSPTYMKGKAQAVVFRTCGVLVHDSTTSTYVSFGETQIDYTTSDEAWVKTPSAVRSYRISPNASAFTLGAVTTSCLVEQDNVKETFQK